MSESSETKEWITIKGEQVLFDGEELFSASLDGPVCGPFDPCLVVEDDTVAKLNAALNQPAACGPGLMNDERAVLSYVLADPCQTSWLSNADNETLRNLLARDAKADTAIAKGEYVEPKMTPAIARDMLTDIPDTVTLRREVLEELIDLFRDATYRLGKSDMGFGEDWEDSREETVAEAEAALAAKEGV